MRMPFSYTSTAICNSVKHYMPYVYSTPQLCTIKLGYFVYNKLLLDDMLFYLQAVLGLDEVLCYKKNKIHIYNKLCITGGLCVKLGQNLFVTFLFIIYASHSPWSDMFITVYDRKQGIPYWMETVAILLSGWTHLVRKNHPWYGSKPLMISTY